jgi:hypothetical protein
MEPQELEQLFADSDVIHINQYPPVVNYRGLDLRDIISKNWNKVIFEFHGAPELDFTGHPFVLEIKDKCPIILVHPYYKKWIPNGIVPSITTPVDTERWTPNWRRKEPPYICGKSSSSGEGKNFQEWIDLCRGIDGLEEFQIFKKTHKQCLQIKRDKLDLGHDSYDLGYVNISAFENACFGVPTLTSGKTDMPIFEEMVENSGLPFEDVRDNDEAEVLVRSWIKDPDLINERSREIRAWMETYWSGRDCARVWTKIYEENVK